MTVRRNAGWWLAVVLLVPIPLAAAPPIAAYGQLPAIDQMSISPDGRRYAAIIGDEKGAQIQVGSLADGKLIAVAPVSKAKARGIYWAGNDHVLVMVSTTQGVPDGFVGRRSEWFQVQDLDLVARKSRMLMDKVKGAFNVVEGTPVPISFEGQPAVIVPSAAFVYGQGFMSALYRYDVASGKTVLIETGKPLTYDWAVDAEGRAVARAEYDSYKAQWTLSVRAPGGDWIKARVEPASIDVPNLIGLDDTGSAVLVRLRDGEDWAVHPVNIADGHWGAAIPGFNADGLITDRSTLRLAATIVADMAAPRYQFRDPTDQRAWDAIAKAFPGEVVWFTSWSNDRMAAIVHVSGRRSGDGYFLIDRRTREARPLGASYPGVGPADIGEQRVLRYKAGDGLEIPAYLTLPPERMPKGLPLVVLPHGGPGARDEPGFDWWAQAIASRGYAVLQPQFRGSEGLGNALLKAGYGEYGRKMQSDLSDGVRQLASDGIIDPARVCIVGGSYGGYAALAGVAFEPRVYRCAASLAGPSDMGVMLAGGTGIRDNISPKRNLSLRFWLRYLGAASVLDPVLAAVSPASHADRIKAPVLLIHGKDDLVVNPLQSRLMERALKAAGGQVEFITLDGEDHWLSRATTRVQMLEAMVAFLEKHNPPDTVAAK